MNPEDQVIVTVYGALDGYSLGYLLHAATTAAASAWLVVRTETHKTAGLTP